MCLRSLAIFLLQLQYTTLHYWHPRLQPYLLIYHHTRPYTGVCLCTIIAFSFQIHFLYGIAWITPFRRVMTRSLRARYNTDFRALIASAKCLDMSSQWRLTIAETMRIEFTGNLPMTCHNPCGPEVIWIWDLRIAVKNEAWIVYPIEVNSMRDNPELIPGRYARRCVGDRVSQSQLQRSHHIRTWRLSIAASMRFDKLLSNWVNWWLLGWCQSPYVHNSHVTRNAKAGQSLEAVYEWRAIHVDPHRQWQFQSQLHSAEPKGVIYVTDNYHWYNYQCPWPFVWQSSRQWRSDHRSCSSGKCKVY